MPDDRNIDSLGGRTVRWMFVDGPTAGKAYEHRFNADGSVEFWSVEGDQRGKPSRAARAGSAKIADQIVAVSYLADSGYTLTVVLDMAAKTMVGFASNGKEWFQQRGTFDIVA